MTNQSQSEPGKHEAVMHFLNDAIDPNSDLYTIMVWGIKDVTYFTDDQGKVIRHELDDDHKYLGNYRLVRTGNEEYRVGSWGETQPNMVPAFARADTLPVVFSVRGLVPALPAQAELDVFIAEKHAAFATGQESFDNWDSFVDEAMTTFSGQEILDDATTQLKALGLIQ